MNKKHTKYKCVGCQKRFHGHEVVVNFWGDDGYLCRKCAGVNFDGWCVVCSEPLTPHDNCDTCGSCLQKKVDESLDEERWLVEAVAYADRILKQP